jgi:hypothetical protein
MKKLGNRVKVSTGTVGNGTMTFGAVTSASFFTPAEAGFVDGDVVAYIAVDGSNVEQGFGTIGGTVTTLSRDTVRISKISGVAGTTKLTLSGAAILFVGPSAEDLMFHETRGTDIASAGTLNLETVTGGFIGVTGTATISAVTLGAGHERWVRFAGALQITVGSSLVGNGAGSNIAVAAGDVGYFRGDSSGVVRFVIFRLSGKPLIGPAVADITDASANGRSLISAANYSAMSALLAPSGLPGRNILINPHFMINQMGYVSAATLAAGVYGHDCWKGGASGGNYSFSQLSSPTTVTIAANKSIIEVIETKNVVGGSYVLAWTGTAVARVGNNSSTPSGNFAASPILITGQPAAGAMSVEFTGANAAGGSSLATNTGTLLSPQLELGSIPTPVEYRPYAGEELLCFRLYRRYAAVNCFCSYSDGSTTAYFVPFVLFPPMRTTPTGTKDVGGTSSIYRRDGAITYTFSTLSINADAPDNWTNCTSTGLSASPTQKDMHVITNIALSSVL